MDVGTELSVARIAEDLGFGGRVVCRLGVLWGKSAARAGGRVNLLLSHLVDTAAVAERMWDAFLSPGLRKALDDVSGGHGRRLFSWLCGVHDVGKATPVFQACDEASSRAVRAAGLRWNSAAMRRPKWRHDVAGAMLLRDRLAGVWSDDSVGWVWPLVAGHHGRVPGARRFRSPTRVREHQGADGEWREVQEALLDVFTAAVGFSGIRDVEPVGVLARGYQLALSGLIVMADWIASNQSYFVGVDDLSKVSLGASRVRAERAWRELRLRGGWGRLPIPSPGVVRGRFGEGARPFQELMELMAWEMPGPGIMLVEAPMGEGKTKGALAVAEILAARFGADGVFVGMPTQATCDPMYSTIRRWSSSIEECLGDQVALLHGKKRLNREWREVWAAQEWSGEDYESICEDDDPYGVEFEPVERQAPSEWFLGRYRGLLSGLVVGTIDQLLFAATRTKHVMVRFAGLAGKVVVIDEVHAADVYMEQFLAEALRWLGQAGVPVVLLSATVAPRQRQALVEAYLGVSEQLPPPDGYPCVTTGWTVNGVPESRVRSARAWRVETGDVLSVEVDVLRGQADEVTSVAEAAVEEVGDGGVALVILNTVERAQRVYELLAKRIPERVLLHGQLPASARAERTEECLRSLGLEGPRPERLAVVATQVAEQSFDIDADVLITDIAPVDLLLQRLGRIHRHLGRARRRPPRMIVAGLGFREDGPELHRDSVGIYGAHRLIRTAHVVNRARTLGWTLPEQIPTLVAEVYGEDPLVPVEWRGTAEAAAADWAVTEDRRRADARPFVLTNHKTVRCATLDGLHGSGDRGADDEVLQALVRDGEPSVEVVLVRRDAGRYRALSGERLGVNGEASIDILDQLMGGATRLPRKLNTVAADLEPLEGWRNDPMLRSARALVLEDNTCQLGPFTITYRDDIGLTVSGGSRKPR